MCSVYHCVSQHGSPPGWPHGSTPINWGEPEADLVGHIAQLADWGHSQIGLMEILMRLLTLLASETSLAGTPQKQDSKISLGSQAGELPGRRSTRRDAHFPQSYRSAQRTCKWSSILGSVFSVYMSSCIQNQYMRVWRESVLGILLFLHGRFPQPLHYEGFYMLPLKMTSFHGPFNDVITTFWSEKRLCCIVLNVSNVGTSG